MHALIISSLKPPRPGIDVHGTYKRLALHIRALHALGASLEIAYYVTDEDVPPDADLDAAAARQEPAEAAHWGIPARVRLIRRRRPAGGFVSHYLEGMLSAGDQPAMAPWGGPEQAAAVGHLVDTGPDLVVVNNLHATTALLRSGRRPKRLFFDLDDVQHRVRLRWCKQKPSTPGKILMLTHIPALLLAERAAARAAEATFVCGEEDRAHLARLGLPRVLLIPNAVDVPAQTAELATEPRLLFVGAMGHGPNQEAAERLVRQILPLVRRQRPDALLALAGQGSEALSFVAPEVVGVELLGFVPDISALYDRCAVFVCPMTNGGGTRIKLLEAAAFGLPIVSTTMGAEGLALKDGVEIVLAETDAALADACVALLNAPASRARIGEAGRCAINKNFNSKTIQKRLEQIFAGTT